MPTYEILTCDVSGGAAQRKIHDPELIELIERALADDTDAIEALHRFWENKWPRYSGIEVWRDGIHVADFMLADPKYGERVA